MTFAQLKAILCGADGTQGIIQDLQYYAGIGDAINGAVASIAAGIRMPNGIITPPLPDLYTMDTVATDPLNPFVAMPDDYQRHLFMVADHNGEKVNPPRGGSYTDFALFLRSARRKDLAQSGSLDRVCLKGRNLYYQDIPSAAQTLTLHYYRLPVAMTQATDTPDGIPEHLQTKLIQHFVARDIYGHGLEDGQEGSSRPNYSYHHARFLEGMTELLDFIGIDAEPEYYASNDGCDW